MASHPDPSRFSMRRRFLIIGGGVVFLMAFLGACNLPGGFLKTKTQSNISWRKTESPLFPSNWPPTADTVWVRYTFAYGTDLSTLIDGSYVTRPLSKTEWKAGVKSATVELSSDMSQAGIQGMVPIDERTRKMLENDQQVSADVLKLKQLPGPNEPETEAIRAYYQAWFRYNGAFLKLIRDSHAGFIDWVKSNP